MKNINEIYLAKMLKEIEVIYPETCVSTFFSGMYNYVPVEPKTNIYAHDYYLYVKVFNNYYKDDNKIFYKFSLAINQLLEKEELVSAYVAYEVLIAQLKLAKNRQAFFKINNNQMILWFKQISVIFIKNKDRLNKIKYGLSKMYDDGLEGLIRSTSEIVDKEYGVKVL